MGLDADEEYSDFCCSNDPLKREPARSAGDADVGDRDKKMCD